MIFWTGGIGMTYIIDISIAWLTLFVTVRYFLAMSNVLKVWPKGVHWQVWGAGGRHWWCVLIYRAASCNFCSTFNLDNVNLCMVPYVQTFPAWYTYNQSGNPAKWFLPCNHLQLISIWQQLWAVPVLLFVIRVGTVGEFPPLFCFWSAMDFFCTLQSGPVLATNDN